MADGGVEEVSASYGQDAHANIFKYLRLTASGRVVGAGARISTCVIFMALCTFMRSCDKVILRTPLLALVFFFHRRVLGVT